MDPLQESMNDEPAGNIEEEEQIEALPKKKELSQKQIDHLNAIRGKALERKREIKLQKHEEYKKKAMEKKVQQIELKQEDIKQERAGSTLGYAEPKQEPKEEPKQEDIKPKKKVLKKIIKYVEADDDEDNDEEVIITKPKKKEFRIFKIKFR